MRLTEDMHTPRPLEDWNEDIGPVLWWAFPVDEAPYVGSPMDVGRLVQITIDGKDFSKLVGGWPGYHTHWTPLPDAAAVERLAPAPAEPDDSETITLTSELLHAGGNSGCGFSRQQIEALGLRWPAEKGWLSGMIGKTIPRSQYDLFRRLRKKRDQAKVPKRGPRKRRATSLA